MVHDSWANGIVTTDVSGVPGPWLFEGAAAEGEGRRSDAAGIYESVGKHGDPRGNTALGVLVGRPPDQDEAAAVAAFELGVAGGDIDALVLLGDACLAGRGTAVDARRALELFERASELGSAPGARRAGDLWWTEALGERNVARADEFWKRSVALGREPAALLSLAESAVAGSRFVEGVGWAIRAAYLTREMLFEPSGDRRWKADHDEPAARERLAAQLEAAMDLVNHHRVEVYEAAKEGDPEACWHWGRVTSLGFGDLPDPTEGRTWLVQAAANGHAASLHALAQSARRDGDLALFETNLRAAAQQGYPPAMHDLGFALYSGTLADGEDRDGAIEAYRSIAGIDHPATATDLSFVLEDVEGAAAEEEALRWLRVAADAGEVAALRRLGERLRDGEGVEADAVGAACQFLAAYYLGWDEGIETVAGFVDALGTDDIIEADRRADGSGFAASVLLERSPREGA